MSTTFAALGVPDHLARALSDAGIDEPFPIQAATIPDALAGRDLCGRASTGSGKTIAFGVPLLARVRRASPKHPKGLVLVPTRELATQVAEELRRLSGDIRILAVYGGAGLEGQIKQLRRGVDVVVACPGRLADLIERNTCSLRDVEIAVVDEADRMADMGFLPEVKRLLDQTSDERQTLLFSATLDGAVDELVRRYQHDPAIHELPDGPSGQVDHHFWLSERPGRVALTAEIIDRVGSTIVFCRTRHGADRVARQLERSGVRAAAIHGNRTQGQRERALHAFHNGRVDALVATDVAARGIHVTGVQCVVHFDLPEDPKDYVHRSGRTGRAGADGQVVALVEGARKRDASRLRRDADVQAELIAPAVDQLTAGDRAARPAAADRRPQTGRPTRPARSERSDRSRPPVSDRSERRDRPEWTDRPTRTATRHDGSARRPTADGHGGRTDRPEGSRRPVPDRDGPRRPRPERGRDDRPRARDTDADRAPAFDATAPRSETPRFSGPSDGADGGSPPASGGGKARAKVRPSGAARRKAKRESQIAAGEAPTRAKKKRSGRPRPPAKHRSR